jgi:uncharacterized delta-60 repeat protein
MAIMNTSSLTLFDKIFDKTKRWLTTLGVVALAVSPLSSLVAQVPGSFDTTFGATNGYISALAIGTNDSDQANAIALQPDGKIILAGTCARNLGETFCMARLMPDGSLDTSFIGPNTTSGNGKFLMTVAGAIAADAVAVAVQPDGKILVAGTCIQKFCITRLNENGTFDASFIGPLGGAAGHFSFSISAAESDTLNGMALQPDGKIVLVGVCDNDNSNNRTLFCAARLNTDGSFDTSFDGPVAASPGNGKFTLARIKTDSEVSESARAVLIRPNGRILLAGICGQFVCLAQLNASGTFDTTFDGSSSGNGRFVVPIFNANPPNGVKFAVLQPDGNAVLAGTCLVQTLCAIRITPTGALDPSFGDATSPYSPGAVVLGSSLNFYGFAIQPDGKLLVGYDDKLLRTYADSGSPDLSFDGPTPSNGNGTVTFDFAADFTGIARAIAIQPDGKIVLAGFCDSVAGSGTSYKFCVARLNGGPFAARNCSPDIDGDGRMTATVDALINTRVMLGLTGSAVIGGITFPANATRNSWSEIRTYLVSQCGMTIAP